MQITGNLFPGCPQQKRSHIRKKPPHRDLNWRNHLRALTVCSKKHMNFIKPISLNLSFVLFFVTGCSGNPDAKRLYDDLLSNYNKLVRPVVNVTDALTVKIKLKLSQLIDVVSFFSRKIPLRAWFWNDTFGD